MSLFGGPTPAIATNPPPSSPPDVIIRSTPPLDSLSPRSPTSADGNDEELDEGELSSSSDRPHRFQGSAGKWRRYNQAERDLTASLNRLEDEDLAIHLYDAHSLKRQLYETNHSSPDSDTGLERPRKRRVEQWHRKERWIKPYEEDGEKSWYPEKRWTAWPLEPHEVPRSGERLSRSWEKDEEEERWTVKRRDDGQWKPSAELEEVMVGVVLRMARERFRLREAEEALPSDVRRREKEMRSQSVVSERRTEEAESDRVMGGTSDYNSEMSRDNHRRNQKSSRTPASDRDGAARRTPAARGTSVRDNLPMHQSRASAPPDEQNTRNLNMKPVILADDEQAKNLLHPSIRHVLQKLDALLMSLHHSRQNHVDPNDSDSATDAHTRTSRESSTATERESGRSRSRSRSRGRKARSGSRKRRGMRSERQTERLLKMLRPRDWSEVIGAAAVAGWGDGVIGRAVGRCRGLFGESMEFGDVGGVGVEEDDGGGISNGMEEVDAEDEMYEGVHVDGFMQPIRLRGAKRRKVSRDGKGGGDESTASEADDAVHRMKPREMRALMVSDDSEDENIVD